MVSEDHACFLPGYVVGFSWATCEGRWAFVDEHQVGALEERQNEVRLLYQALSSLSIVIVACAVTRLNVQYV